MMVAWTKMSGVGWERGLDSGCVLEIKSTGLADRLDVEGEREFLS